MPLCVLFVETCMSFEVFTPTFSNAFVTGVPLWNGWQMVYEKQCCPKIFAFFTSSVTLLTTLSQFFFSICKNYSFIPFHTPELNFLKIQLLQRLKRKKKQNKNPGHNHNPLTSPKK